MGPGWRLGGISSISLTNAYGGAPKFIPAQDVYRLDGEILLACDDGDATAPYAAPYPTQFKTTHESGSCLAGGQFVTERDNGIRIVVSEESHNGHTGIKNFTVTRKDGTKYIYRASGVLENSTIGIGDDRDVIAFQSRYLLWRIEDLQATPNKVTFTYAFTDIADGYAPRVTDVEYGSGDVLNGYRMEFHYDAPTDPMASFGTGHESVLGKQLFRLRSVTVYDDAAPIRAYALTYGATEETGRSRLASVQEYGNDFALGGTNSAEVVSGGTLPAYAFSYQSETRTYQTESYTDTAFLPGSRAIDTNFDGRADLISPDYVVGEAECFVGPDIPAATIAEETVSFSKVRVASDLTLPDFMTDGLENGASRPNAFNTTTVLRTIGNPDRANSDQRYATVNRIILESGGGQTSNLALYGADPVTARLGLLANNVNPAGFTSSYMEANIDPDPLSEVIKLRDTSPHYFDITAGGFSAQTALPLTGTERPSYFGDFDGDGQQEILAYPKIQLFGGPLKPQISGATATLVDWGDGALLSKQVPNPLAGLGFDYLANKVALVATGDVNGDGFDDIVVAQTGLNVTQKLFVSLSTGNGFAPAQEWTLAGLPSLWDTANNRAGSIEVRDINRDGLGDLLLQEPDVDGTAASCPAQTHKSPLTRNMIHVRYSTGSALTTPPAAAASFPGYVTSADFDGDGFVDFVEQSVGSAASSFGVPAAASDGRIRFNDAPAPNLLSQVTDNLGGITEVAYMPSSSGDSASDPTFDNEQHFVSQVVASITRRSGINRAGVAEPDRLTSYRYAGARYDYERRRSLGFASVTAVLPTIDGETINPEQTTEYDNSHIGTKGVALKQTLATDTTVWRETENAWATRAVDQLPYQTTKTQVLARSRHGNSLVETKTTYAYDPYLERISVNEFGFDGPNDDRSSKLGFFRNLTDYIVNKPAYTLVGSGLNIDHSDTDRATRWLRNEWYTYDDNDDYWDREPTIGNVSEVKRWDGDPNAESGPTTNKFQYDAFGNVLMEWDALENETTYEYDTGKNLFLTKETNDLGH